MILVLTLPDGIWIGADSFRGTGTEPPQSLACKVHPKWDGVLLKAGLEEGSHLGGNYSVDEEVERTLSEANSWEDFKSKAQILLEQEVTEALPTYPFLLDQKSQDRLFVSEERQLVIIRFVESNPVIEVLTVSPKRNDSLLPLSQYSVENNGGWQLRHHLVYHGYPSLPDRLVGNHTEKQIEENPVQALKSDLGEVHRHIPCAVGPPYAIAHFYPVKATTTIEKRRFRHDKIIATPARTQFDWIEPGLCPSWLSHELIGNELSEIGSCDLVPLTN